MHRGDDRAMTTGKPPAGSLFCLGDVAYIGTAFRYVSMMRFHEDRTLILIRSPLCRVAEEMLAIPYYTVLATER